MIIYPQWPRGLRLGSAAARLLRSWVRIPPEAWMFVSCECCVLSSRGLCDGLITRPEESYWVWCVWVWSRNLVNGNALSHWGGYWAKKERTPLTTDLFGSRTVLQLEKKFPAFYGTWKLFTILDVLTVCCVPQNQNIATNIISSFERDVHRSVHHYMNLIEITNKMRPCSRIYYSNVS